MDTSKFLSELAEILECEISEDTVLADTSAWDSMAIVMTVALVDDAFGVHVPGPKIGECVTVNDIIRLALQ